MGLRNRLFALAFVGLLLAGSAAPLAASAVSTGDYSGYSVEQLEALIVKLQKQLEELKNRSSCFVSDEALSLGDGEEGDNLGSQVKRLQDFLREKGFFFYKSTGYFGKMTRASLVAYQRSAGLSQTGEFDAATRSKAHAAYCKNVIKSQVKTEAKSEKSAEKAEKKESTPAVSPVRSITLSSAGGANVTWKIDGKSSKGFKVVWSLNAAPVYPNREGDRYIYLEQPAASQATLEAFAGAGSYHVRVCEYLGGACGVYSNEILVNLTQ